MMKKRTVQMLLVILAAAIYGCASPHHNVQSEAELLDIVGGGSYPWVLVRVSITGSPPEIVCMEEPRLTVALLAELNLTNAMDPQIHHAISNAVSAGATSAFHFSTPEARKQIPRPCSPQALASMRQALSSYSNRELLKHDFGSRPLELSGFEAEDPNDAERVFAQVLIERGLRPFIGCFSGTLHIQKAKKGSTTIKPGG